MNHQYDNTQSGNILGDTLVQYLDPLGDACDGEELLVLVELDGGHDGAVVDGVAAVGERGERPQRAVARERHQVLAEQLQPASATTHACRPRTIYHHGTNISRLNIYRLM